MWWFVFKGGPSKWQCLCCKLEPVEVLSRPAPSGLWVAVAGLLPCFHFASTSLLSFWRAADTVELKWRHRAEGHQSPQEVKDTLRQMRLCRSDYEGQMISVWAAGESSIQFWSHNPFCRESHRVSCCESLKDEVICCMIYRHTLSHYIS